MLHKPNLFIIGAMKAGTSSLYKCLSDHPEIFMSPVKEPKYFSDHKQWSKGPEQYLKLFSKARSEAYLGEASPSYTGLPWNRGIAKRIYDFNSSAKIIYILRDPLERMVSHYRHYLDRGEVNETLSEWTKKSCDLLMLSNYAYQLEPYLQLFGRDAIYIVTLEEMRDSPRSFYEKVFKWLGIDAGFIPIGHRKRFHRSGANTQPWDDSSLVVQIARRIKTNTLVDKLTPRFVQELIVENLPKKNDPLFSNESYQKEIDKVKKRYQPILSKWIMELEIVTGRDYDIWPTTRIKPSDKIGLGSLCIDKKLPPQFR